MLWAGLAHRWSSPFKRPVQRQWAGPGAVLHYIVCRQWCATSGSHTLIASLSCSVVESFVENKAEFAMPPGSAVSAHCSMHLKRMSKRLIVTRPGAVTAPTSQQCTQPYTWSGTARAIKVLRAFCSKQSSQASSSSGGLISKNSNTVIVHTCKHTHEHTK